MKKHILLKHRILDENTGMWRDSCDADKPAMRDAIGPMFSVVEVCPPGAPGLADQGACMRIAYAGAADTRVRACAGAGWHRGA
jgi:hypothetical protein